MSTSAIVFGFPARRVLGSLPNFGRRWGGGDWAFRCLPFGRKYSPVRCQRVLERLIEDAGLVGVLVLVYLDDVLIVGQGRLRVRTQMKMSSERALRGGCQSEEHTGAGYTPGVALEERRSGGRYIANSGECMRGAMVALVGGRLHCMATATVFGACTMALQVRLCTLATFVGGLGPCALGTPPFAVYPPQVASFHVCGVRVGIAGLVSRVPPQAIE